MVKEETVYSIPWRAVNIMANITVAIKPYKAPLLFPCINEWWAYVTVTPLDNNITVLSKGNSKGLIASIPIGGHWAPNSTVGDKALWKKAQKIAKKNKASDTIKRATPIFNPLCTAKVWLPKYVASLITSLNQKDIEEITNIKAKVKKYSAWLKPCIDSTPLVVKVSKEIQVYMGQGEGDTRWKGCAWNVLLIKFVILFSIYIFKILIIKSYN